jgi:hypothetical protein
LNVYYSQTVYLNRLKLSQVEYYNEYDFVEFFQFFLTSLNFVPVLLERHLNLLEKIEKIPKKRIYCNIQPARALASCHGDRTGTSALHEFPLHAPGRQTSVFKLRSFGRKLWYTRAGEASKK